MSVFPSSAKSFITKEGSVPSKNLLRSILGETFFIIKFNGELEILLCLFKIKLPKIKLEIIKINVKKTINNFVLVVTSNKMTEGTKKIVTTIKLNEYVPTYDKICKNWLTSTKLKEIKFQGKPPKMWPLKYSIDEKVNANKKKLKKIFHKKIQEKEELL